MIIVKPSFEIESKINKIDIYAHIEKAARTCYKSESKETTTMEDKEKFIIGLIKRGHVSTIEHYSISVRFICDRGVSHEIVRHRLCAFSQESTRFCNYSGKGIELIHPDCLSNEQKKRREDHFWKVQELYDQEISERLSPQIARGVLPTALKTELVLTANIREWRHILNMRAVGIAGKPHPQMLELMNPLLDEMIIILPALFNDLKPKNNI